jgi:hypothetical protein
MKEDGGRMKGKSSEQQRPEVLGDAVIPSCALISWVESFRQP